MTKHTSVVELNGNRYDAVSGQIIGAAKGAAASLRTASGSIDGFMRAKVVKPTLPPRHSLRAPAQRAGRLAQRSQTLMRSTVNKPSTHQHQSSHKKIGSGSLDSVNPKRSFKAKTVTRSEKIIKFSKNPQKKSSKAAISGEVLPLPSHKFSRANMHSKQSTPNPMPSMVTSVSHQKLERLLDQALVGADSHKKTLHHKRGRLSRLLHSKKYLSVAILVLLLAVCVFAWQRVPQFSIKVAAATSHVPASAPAYVPPGYTMAGHAGSSEGKVTVSFKSKEDPAKVFTITQRNTNMGSTAMASTLLPPKASVQTSQINGTTVYVYDGQNDAMWVNHGIHYQIHDKANLDSNEVLHIAQSL